MTEEKKNKLLLVVDMQNDFLTDALENDNAKNIRDDLVKEVREKIEEGYEIFFTKDTHNEDYLNTMEGKNLPIKHCIKGTKGWELIDELNEIVEKNSLQNHIIEKETFGDKDLSKKLEKVLQSEGKSLGDIDSIRLIGVCTSICVLSNALILKAFTPEIEIEVDEDLCACLTKESHNAAIKAMETAQVKIV